MQACTGGGTITSAVALAMPALLQHAPLRRSLLVDTRKLYSLLLQKANWVTPAYMPAYALPCDIPAQLQGPDAFIFVPLRFRE